jgi:hypothetical protein
MANVEHGALQPGAASGIHVIHHWIAANQAAREALSVTDAEVGKVCKQTDTSPPTFWLLGRVTGGVAWIALGGAEAAAAVAALRTPEYLVAALTSELSNERTLEGTGPVSVSFATAQKAIITIATALGGGSPAAGLMSGADKVAFDAAITKLAGIAAGATAGPADPTVAPLALSDSTATLGATGKYATEQHVHPHGTRSGGTLHATALGGGSPAAGFMSGADKVAHDANTAALPNKVTGPASAAANQLPKFSDTTGKVLSASGVSIDAGNAMSGLSGLTVSGTITGNVVAALVMTLAGTDLAALLALKADKLATISSFATLTRTLVLADNNTVLMATGTSSAEQVVTIPTDASLNLPIGYTVTLLNRSALEAWFMPEVSGYPNPWGGTPDMFFLGEGIATPGFATLPYCQPGGAITAMKVGANLWWLSGNVTAEPV